jgi:hypothetical protein
LQKIRPIWAQRLNLDSESDFATGASRSYDVTDHFKECRMIRLLVFALVCIGVVAACGRVVASPADAPASIEWQKTEEGETAFVPMKSAPYPHPSRDNGYTYNKVTFPREPHYSDSTVGLFIPRG